MQLHRVLVDDEWMFVTNNKGRLRTHEESDDCDKNGCVLHNPTMGHRVNVEGWPYWWRTDRGIMERLCPDGVGHPDPDSANYLTRTGKPYENVHGCDGCCFDYGTRSLNPRHKNYEEETEWAS